MNFFEKRSLFYFFFLLTGSVVADASTKLTVPENISKDYGLLMSGENLVVGIACGYAAQIPEGLIAIRKLAHFGRIDLMENVLHGPNKGARIYAAQALLESQKRGMKVSLSDNEVIRKMILSKEPVTVCVGCFWDRRTAVKILGFKKNSLFYGVSIFQDEKVNFFGPLFTPEPLFGNSKGK